MKRIRTIILDNHPGFLNVLSRILSRYPFMEVVGWAESGEEALGKVAEYHPDLVTVDINLPDINGFQLAELIKKLHPDTRIIFITLNGDPCLRDEAERGGYAYIAKHELPERLQKFLAEIDPNR